MERTVPQGAKPALAVGDRVPPQVIHTGGQARLQSTALLYCTLLYCTLWADSGQGCAIQRQGEPVHRGWAASRDPRVMGTTVLCGEIQLQTGDTAGAAPLQGRGSAPPGA